jgi:hypothetical protein
MTMPQEQYYAILEMLERYNREFFIPRHIQARRTNLELRLGDLKSEEEILPQACYLSEAIRDCMRNPLRHGEALVRFGHLQILLGLVARGQTLDLIHQNNRRLYAYDE